MNHCQFINIVVYLPNFDAMTDVKMLNSNFQKRFQFVVLYEFGTNVLYGGTWTDVTELNFC